ARQMERWATAKIGPHALESLEDAVDLLRAHRRICRQDQGVEVLGILLEDRVGIFPRLVPLPSSQVDLSQLQSQLVIARVLGLRSAQEGIGGTELAESEVGETDPAHGDRVLRFDPEHVAVLEDRFLVGLAVEELSAALEMPRLLRFR